MNKKSNQTLLTFLLRAKFVADSRVQQRLRQRGQSEGGYAMLVVSIVTIVIFSLLSAYLLVTRQNTAITSAYIDGANTFYAAESGLNKRADDIRKKFVGYQTPQGLSPGQSNTSSVVTPANISNCFTVTVGTAIVAGNDLACQNYRFNYLETSAGGLPLGGQRDAIGGNSAIESKGKNIDYLAYTFVKDATSYTTGTNSMPITIDIPNDEPFGGLKALEYKYTIYSSAVKKTSATTTNPLIDGLAQSILQMDFKSRVIPLFQFGVLYERDLEAFSSYDFTLSGRVHTNGNLYVQATSFVSPSIYPLNGKTDFLDSVTVAEDVYNSVWSSDIYRYGDVRFRNTSGVYQTLPQGSLTRITPLTSPELSPFYPQLQSNINNVKILTLPDAGFLRKRNYKDDKIGAYFAKADLRIEMVPDRAVPFNVTAIQSGNGALGNTCDTTAPAADADPSETYIDSTRNEAATAKCAVLNAGQLLSLQQPIMVRAKGNTEEEERFCKRTAASTGAIIDRTRQLIDYDNITTYTVMNDLPSATQDQILKALQVAILTSPTPIDYSNVTKQTGFLTTNVEQEFRNLLNRVREVDGSLLNGGVRNQLRNSAPARLAKSRKSCFLSAPIQMVKKSGNLDSFVERRELFTPDTTITARKILQTNIESLTVWNRDGQYIGVPNDRTVVPSSIPSNISEPTFDSPEYTGTYATKGVLFKIAAADSTAQTGSFQRLGMGALDTTEGGLVLYHTVNDDLNGDGIINAANDVTAPDTNLILKVDAAGNNALDVNGLTTTLDYHRKYKNSSNLRHSPYGFAIVGGNNLPGALSIVTDQSLYVQGDYNNYLLSKKSAALMADAISTLSVNCISPGTTTDPQNVYTGQINCGIPVTLTANSPWTGLITRDATSSTGTKYEADPTTYNTALLSSTNSSRGNYGTGRGGGSAKQEGGAINIYTRLVENWNNKQQTLLGSIVSLSIPIENKEPKYVCNDVGSYCTPPVRVFSFDTDFNNFNQLPPLTPQAVYLQQSVYSRQ